MSTTKYLLYNFTKVGPFGKKMGAQTTLLNQGMGESWTRQNPTYGPLVNLVIWAQLLFSLATNQMNNKLGIMNFTLQRNLQDNVAYP